MLAMPTQNSRKKKHHDMTPLIKIDLTLFPKTLAHNQKRKTYKAVSNVSHKPQMANIAKFILATFGTVDKYSCISGLTRTKYLNTSEAFTQMLVRNVMAMKSLATNV